MRVKRAAGIAAAFTIAGLAAAGTLTTADAAGSQLAAGGQQQEALEHGFGLNIAGLTADTASADADAPASPVFDRAGAPPASFDLTQYANKPGDQGQVGSCVTWATGYTGYGVLMNEQKIKGGPMAPMFIYSQISKGHDQGTWARVALPMEQQQGIDTKSDYKQGDFDYTTQPTARERANAAHYKLSGFTKLPTSGTAARQAIEDAISKGQPVPFGFAVHQSFMRLNSQTAGNYSYLPGPASSDPVVGGHEVTIVAYNDKGVKVENSWGGRWGAQGYFTVPWKFFSTGDVQEVHAMGKLVQG